MRLPRMIALLFVAALLGATLAACGGSIPAATSAPGADTTEAPATDEALSGDVVIDGSSTVFPLMTAAVEEYNAVQPDVRPSVGESGTGGGFKKFCGIDQAPSTDISDASRPIKAEGEADACAAAGVEYIELKVAIDGLTVVTNPENDWVTCLDTEQLGKLFMPVDADNADTWADVDPSWPAETIKFFVPDPDSGTRDSFIEHIIVPLKLPEDQVNIRQDDNTQFSSDDNQLLTGVAGEKNGLGFFGFSYYINNTDKVKAVEIKNKDGNCVAPSDETVQDGTYNPLARALYIYVNKKSLTEKPQVADMVKFLMSEDGFQAVMSDVGYSLPPEGTYEANMAAVEEALK